MARSVCDWLTHILGSRLCVPSPQLDRTTITDLISRLIVGLCHMVLFALWVGTATSIRPFWTALFVVVCCWTFCLFFCFVFVDAFFLCFYSPDTPQGNVVALSTEDPTIKVGTTNNWRLKKRFTWISKWKSRHLFQSYFTKTVLLPTECGPKCSPGLKCSFNQ